MLTWLIVAALAAIGEIVTTGLFLACVCVAALITALVALAQPALAIQIIIFALLSLGAIILIRPFVVRIAGLDAAVQITGEVSQPRLIGKRGIVTRQVDAYGGQIRIGEGEFWSARTHADRPPIPPGDQVEIVLLDGINALVEPVSVPSPQTTHSLPKGDL